MEIAIASDHRGYFLKQELIANLSKTGFSFVDCGTYSEKSSDYPDFAHKAMELFIKKKIDRAILICYTGLGMSITANRYKEIRATHCRNLQYVEYARKHNDSNVLVLSSMDTKIEEAVKMVLLFLKTKFEGGRHKIRLEKINESR